MIKARIILIAAIISLFGGFTGGYKVATWKHEAKLRKIEQKLEKHKQTIEGKQREIEELYTENKRLDEKKRQVITKEIIKYQPTGTMSPQWVSIHDCALQASGETTCRTPSTPNTTTTDRDALLVVTSNYDYCRDTENRFKALQGWVNALYE